ncbi:unnamed protein product [Rotaria sp. Silwood2]|nr:unnamed protein product [Rotaria sp. Silwood2]
MGQDIIVQKLINFISLPKVCPYRQSSSSSLEKSTNMTVEFYPIVFGFIDQYLFESIPRQVLFNQQLKIIDQICLPKKSKDFSDLIPRKLKTYKFGFENELDYRRLYSTAYFAITMKKGGWDCNRHYEIISSGTMPFFDQLNKAGNYTLSLLPKSILYEAQTIPGYYAKHRLTTVKIVEYILNIIRYPIKSSKKHSILYISHEQFDYMKDFMLHGFTRIFEENLYVFKPPKYMYEYPTSKMWNQEETKDYFKHTLYGFGYGYKLALKNYVRLYERDKKNLHDETIIENNIKAKNYSLIVFGSILRNNKLFSLTIKHYERSRIVLIDGEDASKHKDRSEYAKWGTYFLREIPDNCDVFM